MMTIANPRRGCGTLKRGGCYGQSDMGVGGKWAAVVWTLDTRMEERHTVSLELGERGAILFNPAATLMSGELIQDARVKPSVFATNRHWQTGWGDRDVAAHLEDALPPLAILDHVGRKHYDPLRFVQELKRHGPSRRFTPSFARTLALHIDAHGPTPIFFVQRFAILPRPEALNLASIAGGRTPPTFGDPDWGLEARDYDGSDHYIVATLEREDELTALLFRAPTYQTIFVASTICKVRYIAKKGESQLPADLAGAPIEIVDIEESQDD